MTKPVAVWVLSILCSATALAADDANPEATAPAPAVTANALEEIARGLYLETRVGGGYTVADQKVVPDATWPRITGSEQLGAGAYMHFALGYDLTPMIALQGLGGAAVLSTTRTDKVRDLGMMFGGLGLRLALAMGERTNWVVGLGGIYVSSNNGVEPAETGAGVLANVGLEYYVHVRHFSVGIDATVLAALSPQRVFVGLGPTIKYTF